VAESLVENRPVNEDLENDPSVAICSLPRKEKEEKREKEKEEKREKEKEEKREKEREEKREKGKKEKVETPPEGATDIVIGYTGYRISEEDSAALLEMSKAVRISTNLRECTHLLASKIQRTEKFLKAIPYGLRIVHPNWIQDSIAMGSILDDHAYLLKDAEAENKYNFRLKEAVDRAKRASLFSSCIFTIMPDTTPPASVIQELVEACGGHVASGKKRKHTEEMIYIVPSNTSPAIPSARAVWDTEMFLTSVLTQIFPE
jgi:hypothetical protein